MDDIEFAAFLVSRQKAKQLSYVVIKLNGDRSHVCSPLTKTLRIHLLIIHPWCSYPEREPFHHTWTERRYEPFWQRLSVISPNAVPYWK